jgi:hypothetical protein
MTKSYGGMRHAEAGDECRRAALKPLLGRHDPAGGRSASSLPIYRRSLIAAANRPLSGASPPRSAVGTSWPATSRPPVPRASGLRCAASAAPSALPPRARPQPPAAADVLTARLTLCPATLASHRDQGTPRPRLCRTPGAIVAFASLARPAGAIAFRQLLIVSVPLPRMSAPLMNAQMRAAPLAHQCQARRPIQT